MSPPLVPLRRVFRIANGGTPTSSPENWGGGVAWATPVDLAKCHGGKISETQRSLTSAGLHSGSQIVPEGSLLISSRAPIGYIAETTRPMAFNQGCKGLVPEQDVDIRFFRYQLSSMVEQLQSLGQGSTFSELSADDLASRRIVVPSRSQQEETANDLDTETDRIDTLISKNHRLIELLESRRTLLAEEAIAAFRRSESSIPIKYLLRESDCRYGSGPEPTVLSVSIHQGVVPRDIIADKKPRADEIYNYKVCSPGDIAINRMRAFQGGVGMVRHKGIVSPDYTVLKLGSRILPGYLHYVMRSSWFVSEMTRRLRGIGATDQGQVRTPRINFADLGLIEVPVPSRDKQEEFTLRLADLESRLTQMIELQTNQLDLFVERRQALIVAAVTSSNLVSESLP